MLDKSPVAAGEDGTASLRNTIKLAERADDLGYHRFWLAEHHGAPALAGSAPEVLTAHILAKTSRIRVGAGGVLLQHYSPFKVAEVFKVLSALAPGRVDLGIGKAPGRLPAISRALQVKHRVDGHLPLEQQLKDLNGFLDGDLPEAHPHHAAVANPQVSVKPERFLLGGSPDTAVLAAELGWNFAYAGHFNGDPANIERSFEIYRSATGRNPSLALNAFAAPSAARAREAVSHVRVFKLHLADGQRVNVVSLEQAAEFARQAGISDYTTQETPPHVIAGTPDQVHAELDELSRRFGVEEFIIDMPVADPAARLESVELLARRRKTVAA
jgi:luciferase family oxidoreductase group 1